MAQDFKLIGQGLSVYEEPEPVQGPAVWLDSPAAVIDFVAQGRAEESIVIARGGTTTFLTPALTSGVKGVVTLQGHPESHLGILSREYGIPCVMGVASFSEGVQTARGETVPADGAIVRVDVSSAEGRVSVEPGARTEAPPPADPDAEAQAAAQMEQIQLLLSKYRGEIPHFSEGDREMRSGDRTDVLELTDSSLRRRLRSDETNELLAYMGWNIWDFLAQRATEGESGLIPRQEYESVGTVQMWQRYPQFYELLADMVGIDGLIDIGATPRREPANKINLLHIWCSGFVPGAGRGVLCDLGMLDPGEGLAELDRILQVMRGLYRGVWDGGPMFTSMRDYRAPLLSEDWIARFRDELTALEDPDRRARYQKFSASTELMGFLLHFDNRSGLADTGPYPTGDGGFLIVRDHFLYDPVYHWADVATELPHAITQAMFFKPDEDISLALMDGSTLFTKPANYLKHLSGMAVYARDRWDTPASEIRRVDEEEMGRIQETCDRATDRLYRRIAAMPKRDKIMAGAQVYYTEFIMPFARAAGIWDDLVAEHDFFELDPVASEAYYRLIRDGSAGELMPRLFLTGGFFPPTPSAAGDGAAPQVGADALPALHALALRGMAAELPGEVEALEGAGLIASTQAGYMLTAEGQARHDDLLAAERDALDLDRLAEIYERFLAANPPMKALCSRWQSSGEDERFALIGELAELVERAEPALRRTTELVDRFAPYAQRMRAALARAEEGEHDYVLSPRVDSVHTVWMECHEDFLQTLGRSREAEGSY
jgi:phosphohistidine swiveling domain-containing protein